MKNTLGLGEFHNRYILDLSIIGGSLSSAAENMYMQVVFLSIISTPLHHELRSSLFTQAKPHFHFDEAA